METPIRFSLDVGNPGDRTILVNVAARNGSSPVDNTASATRAIRAPIALTRVQAHEGWCGMGSPETGTPRSDRLVGTAYADLLRGGSGDDRLLGRGGNDTPIGGAGYDTIEGNSGNDRVLARDATRDIVRCGTGRDTVVADRGDQVARDL